MSHQPSCTSGKDKTKYFVLRCFIEVMKYALRIMMSMRKLRARDFKERAKA